MQHLQSGQEPLDTSTLSPSVPGVAHELCWPRNLQAKEKTLPIRGDRALPTSLAMQPLTEGSLQQLSREKPPLGIPTQR